MFLTRITLRFQSILRERKVETDGKCCYPIDFSLHREEGKNKDYGLSPKQRKKQFKGKRDANHPDYARKAGCDESKLGIGFKYVLADSWFTCESLIRAVRNLGNESIHYIGLAKMNPKLRYRTHNAKRFLNAHELIVRNERTSSRYCRKYKCRYIRINVKMGEEFVRIFIVKYGKNATVVLVWANAKAGAAMRRLQTPPCATKCCLWPNVSLNTKQ